MSNKPLDFKLIKSDNKRQRKSKKVLEEREGLSVDIGGYNFDVPQILDGKDKAQEKFKFIINLYVDANLLLVTSADLDTVAEYCLIYTELQESTKMRDKLYNNGDVIDIDEFMKYSNLQDKLRTKMVRYSDLLYLNPVSRARTGGKKPHKEKETELEKKGFGNL